MLLNKNIHFHFMGIGGIGMSGIAQILVKQGYRISGCDLDSENKTVKKLIDLGCNIAFSHQSEICNDSTINYLVHTTSVSLTHNEIVEAQNKGIKIIHRSDVLAELMKQNFSIAVGGSHGKTTTSAMISHVLIEAQKDPNIIIGGLLKNIENNSRFGQSKILVCETDESDKSIEKLFPTYGIITNIDLEHLETYNNLNEIKQTFEKFLIKIPFFGKAIICLDDENIRSLLPLNINYLTYGIEQKADITAKNIELFADYSMFDVFKKDQFIGKIQLNMAGYHNILNSLATIATCLDLQVEFEVIKESLKKFMGIERRFCFNGIYREAEIFDDYGHHPNEILNILKVARRRTKNKLSMVFQPHRYSRTAKLWHQFIETFVNYPVDNLIITDIYPAFEEPIDNVNSQNLVKEIKQKKPDLNVIYLPFDDKFEQIITQINKITQKDDLILLQGAGKINKIAQKLI